MQELMKQILLDPGARTDEGVQKEATHLAAEYDFWSTIE